MPKKIGILGGTFDPIHYGHLFMAQFAADTFGLSEVRFVPNGKPPHKAGEPVTDKWLRYEMVKMAVCQNPLFTVSDFEIRQSRGYCYSIDLIRHFHSQEEGDLFFIIGADSFYQIESWYQFEALVRECTIIVVNRRYQEAKNISGEIARFCKKYSADVRLCDMPQMDISSTFLRDRIRAGRSIRYLTSERVEHFILEHHLYCEKEGL